MDWLTQHVWAVVIAAGIISLAIWKSGVLQNLSFLWKGYEERARLTAANLVTAKLTCEELRTDLARCVRENLIRDEINRQDRATIRALKQLCDAHKIDYSQIEEYTDVKLRRQ